jgi:hypothetical protein
MEKMILFNDKRPKGEHRIYTHLYVPIYKKKNYKEGEDGDNLNEKIKRKRDMNLFLKDYFFDEL